MKRDMKNVTVLTVAILLLVVVRLVSGDAEGPVHGGSVVVAISSDPGRGHSFRHSVIQTRTCGR
jgi:hypothetical protein